MRAMLVVLALVAMPFVAGVSQGRGHDAEHCAKRYDKHPDKDINKCTPPVPEQPPVVVTDPPTVVEPPPPPPPDPVPAPTCAVTAMSTVGASIEGQVYVDANPWPGLADWCVELSGPVAATVLTDASGNYRFTGLAPGTYLVCEVLQSGWTETFPTPLFGGVPCPTGYGWTITLGAGGSAIFVNFGNLSTTTP